MSVTYQGLTGADFGPLQESGEAWLQLSQKLGERVSALDDIRTGQLNEENWDGDSAEAGRQRIKDFVADLDERSSQARRIAASIEDAYDELQSCQDDLNDLVAGVDRERASVTDAGGVIPDTSQGSDAIDYAGGISTQIQEILDRATEADAALNAAVGLYAETLDDIEERALDDLATGPAGTLQELIDAGASPERVNEWWNSLSGEEQVAMMDNHPEMLGGLEGIPTDTRDYTNRELLEDEIRDREAETANIEEEIASLEERIAEMEENGEAYSDGSYYSPGSPDSDYTALLSELEELESQRDDLEALQTLQNAIAGPAATGQDHYLLGFDTEDDGGAIVSIGNPDTADHTGVFVPGTFAGIDNFANDDGALGRAETMAEDARASGVEGEETAMVAWLDYDSPQSASPADAAEQAEFIPEAFWGGAAEDGAVTLNHFVDGLDATHQDGDGHTTVVAHSYGARLMGEAAQDSDTGIDQVISVAGAGLGADHASELAVGQENVWTTMAEGDAIEVPARESVIHGRDPTHESFGANVFESDPEEGDGGDIHGGYWGEIENENGTSQPNSARDNMAYIITGQTDKVELVE